MRRPTLVPPVDLAATLPEAPTTFIGTVAELIDGPSAALLPPVAAVRAFHDALVAHLESDDPLFVVRAVGSLERREVVRTASGHRVLAGDNAPPWWTHLLLTQDAWPDASMEAALADLPTHLFDVPAVRHCNAAGWHLAHVLDVNDGDTDWARWDRRELTRRMVRNLHPCNWFFVPKTGWQRTGSDPNVLGYVAWAHRRRYRGLWAEFLGMAGGRPPRADRTAGGRSMLIQPSDDRKGRRKSGKRTAGKRVLAMHFVCRGDMNVRDLGDGTFETGVWKIDQRHAGTVETVALHEDKTQRSYRHGRVVSWRTVEHEGAQRVVFTVRQEGAPLPWHGKGSGEKGYRWSE